MIPPLLIGTRYGQGIKDERWFTHREQVLGNITAPSLLAQTDASFRWAIYIDADMPAPARAALERMTAPFGERVILVTNSRFTSVSFKKLAQEHGLMTPDDRMLTGRIDDDDAWDIETVAQVRAAAARWLAQPERRDVLGMTFPLGLEWIMYDTYDVDVSKARGLDIVRTAGVRPFPRLFHGDSVFVFSPARMGRTCLSANHGKIHDYLLNLPADVEAIDTGRPMWLYTRHKQVSTGIQHESSAPLPLGTADLAASFGIDHAGVDAYIANADDYAYLLEKRTQHRRDTAEKSLRDLAKLAETTSLTEEQETQRRALQQELAQLAANLLGEAQPRAVTHAVAMSPLMPEEEDPEAFAEMAPDADPVIPRSGSRSATTRVLFMSSNGAGMGHLVRLLAMARRAAPGVQPVFFTLSAAVACVRQQGWPVEHMASREYAGEPPGPWNADLARRLAHLLAATRPAAVVFDGAFPYNGLIQARRDHPEIAFVWSRRGLWKADAPTGGLALARHFDLVIEPGDLAAAADAGPTMACRAGVTRVDPVLLLEPGDLLPREEARRRLGLRAEGPAALVQLGAGAINDTHSLTRTVIELLGQWPDLQICVATPPIATAPPELPPAVTPLSRFPLMEFAHAFDVGVAAAGYNTVHEAIMAGLPHLFLPNAQTRMDDQRARAAGAAAQGCGLCVDDPSPRTLAAALATLADPARREAMRQRCLAQPLANGARAAMAAVEALTLAPAMREGERA